MVCFYSLKTYQHSREGARHGGEGDQDREIAATGGRLLSDSREKELAEVVVVQYLAGGSWPLLEGAREKA